MKVEVEIVLDDVLEFIRNNNKTIRDTIISECTSADLPKEYHTEYKRVTIPAHTNKDGTVRKGSVPKQVWQDVQVKNNNKETDVEKEVFPEWNTIKEEIENNINTFYNDLNELFNTYKNENQFVITASNLSVLLNLPEVEKLGFNIE